MPTTDSERSETLSRVSIPLEGSIAGSIIQSNQAVVLDDVSQHPLHYRQVDNKSGFQTRSLLGVPMRIRNRVVGALEAVNKIGTHWEESDVYYLEILAGQAAIALDNAQLVFQLQKVNEELSQVDKLKSDFIAIASHELRTPLGVIMGYASFLKDEAQGELGEHATIVLNSALRMRNLIEDMTNLRFLKLGEAELMYEAMSINDLIELAGEDVATIASANGHQLDVETLEEDVTLQGDRAKLLMALTNILNNAMKFTRKNGYIKMAAINKPNEIWIRISDNGVGILPSELDSIFRPFYQVEDHMTRRHGGMGLGLSIAKAVVEVHRGRIWAESEGQDQGATFTLSLPKYR
jgi:signal transduction histidine kinase